MDLLACIAHLGLTIALIVVGGAALACLCGTVIGGPVLVRSMVAGWMREIRGAVSRVRARLERRR